MNSLHQRLDLTTEAIVNAAAKLMPQYGYDTAFAFMLDTGVPLDVITRVLNGGPLRSRPGAT